MQNPLDDPAIAASLKQISQVMEKMDKNDLSEVMKTQLEDGTTSVAEIAQFLSIITSSATFKISKQDAMSLAQEFPYNPKKSMGKQAVKLLVNITEMQAAIYDLETSGGADQFQKKQKTTQNTAGMRILDRVSGILEDYIAENGGSIFDCFHVIDSGDDNYIQQDEFLTAMKNLGAKDMTSSDVKLLFQVVDENNDGQLSYGEFTKYLGSVHGNKKIDNADHILFVVADQIRRIMRAKNNGIATMFGTKTGKITWVDFLDKLEGSNVSMKPEQADALGDLLDCQNSKDMVDLKLFQDLVGIHVDATQANKNTLKAHKEMVKSAATYSEIRGLMRKIFKPLIDEQVTADKLQLDFNASSKLDKKNPIISIKLYTEIIMGSYETGKRMEGDISKLGGFFKDEKNPLMMNVTKFLDSYKSFGQIFNIETYLFGQIENIQRTKKLKTIESLLQRDSKDEYMSARDFGQALLKIHVKLDEEEIKILVMEFDPSGEASLLHIKLFVEEYEDWNAEAGGNGLKGLKENKKIMEEQLRKPVKAAPRGSSATPARDAAKTAAVTAAPAQNDKPDTKVFDNIITRITQDYAANNYPLSSMFSSYKTPQVNLNQFLDEISESLKGMKLTRGEQDVLANAYKTAKFSEKYDYSQFKQDIKKESSKSTSITERILDEEERKMIEQIKEFVEKKNLSAQLTIEFKKKDAMDRKTLSLVDMQNCIKAIGLTLGTKQFDLLFKILKPNQESKFSYLELLTLIVGQFAAQQLCRATILELEQSTKQSKVNFVPPPSIQSPATARMGTIGEEIRRSQKNYEEAFLKETGDVNRVKPQINEEIIYKVLGNLGVKLDSQQNFELKQYLSELAQGPQKSINLVQFLTNVGLPPQTLGAEAVKTGEPNKVLGEDEKARCQHILIEIGRSMPKGKVLEDYFEKDKNDQIKADDFMYILKKMKGVVEVLNKLKVEQNLPILVIYLCEENQNMISRKKLGLAFKASEKDLPLLQHGTKDLMDYKASIKKQATIKETAKPNVSVTQEFITWMIKNEYTLKDLFPGADLNTLKQIPFGDFQKELKYKNFKSSDEMELLRSLDKSKSNKSIDAVYLKELLTKAQSKVKPNTGNQLANFPPKVKQILDKIEQSMAKQNLTPDTLHSYLDENGDGEVDKKEFVSRLGEAINQRGLIPADIGLVFDTLDRNTDGKISLNEFKTFIKGVTKSREKRMTEIDDNIMKQIRDQISDLFEHFDSNGDGEISPEEIKKTLESFGLKRTLDNCKEMIGTANGGNGDKLNRKQFGDVLIPIMQDQLLSQEDNVEDLRRVFLEADSDYSGYLSVSELWAALKKKGADVSLDDVCELMGEIDIDRDGQLDIDEFISLMSLGDQLPLTGKGAKSTYQKMQQARKMNPVDFVKAFKNMPTNFVTSFMDEQWTSGRMNLPSSVFKAQIDPKTMLWKDVRQVNNEDLRTADKNFKPKLRPMDSSIGCLISFDKAEGVPLPQIGNGQTAFKDEFIVKRAIRICVDIKCGQSRHLVHNSIQVPAQWQKEKEDMWSFEKSDSSLSHILFRTTNYDQLEVKEGRILFELVVYIRSSEESNITEMSCGWCELPLDALKSKQSGRSLNVIGGSPFAEVDIKQEDIRAKRTGLAAVQKAFTGVQKRIVIDITPQTGLKPLEQKAHMTLLPSTCFVHQSLLYFVTGFMNYKADKLLREMSAGQFRKPAGDVVISSFPKIYDNPDIVEELTKCWNELAMPEINKAGLSNCDFITEKTVLFCQRLYPILFSEEFMTIEHTGTTKSGAGSKNSNQEDLAVARKALVRSALRVGEKNQRKENNNPSELTTFKPFSIRELEFDVWDCTRSKQDKFINSIKHHGVQPISKQVTFQDN